MSTSTVYGSLQLVAEPPPLAQTVAALCFPALKAIHSSFIRAVRCHPWLNFPSENAGGNKPRIMPITRMTSD
jgi:hypothetical protein